MKIIAEIGKEVCPPPDGITQDELVLNRLSGDYYVDTYTCYSCNKRGEIQEIKDHPHNKAPYCPVCGLRMVWVCRTDNVSGLLAFNQ